MTIEEKHPNLHILNHPMILHKLSLMRDRHTPTVHFRALLREISLLMAYEITRELPLTDKTIETPVITTQAPVIKGKKIAVIPILRAGLGMSEGILDLIPSAREGHIGLYRDEKTHRPVEYMVKIPDAEGRTFIVVDPMLATGHSAVHAIDVLNRRGVESKNIRMVTLLTTPEGLNTFYRHHPEVKLYTASVDERLDENAFIVPGLGDAGDRMFGTK